MADISNLLACRDVSVGYDEKPVLSKVELAVKRGEIVALLGGSGCGKSTLLRAITGLLPPLAGTIQLLGEDPYALDPDARRHLLRRTGMAFQQDALFGAMSVGDNVALPLRELTKLPPRLITEMVRIKLALVGLSGFERRMPATLSGGQRKRAALARASILDPEILFCDEPSAGLDPVAAAELDDTLRNMRELLGTTIVIVTHELDSIRAIADRAVMFARGAIAGAGTIAELEHSRVTDVFRFFHARSA